MKTRNTSKYDVDGIPPLKESIPLALQHLLAMIVGNMVPAILIANVVGLNQGQATMLIQGSMLAAGLATFLQLYPIP
ncbi:xanthine/uracile permease [Clostridioides difficile]|nr:xanthine/uracile permease [Clostridioides difficile]VIA40336.1 xanthine/uracile permease [Clostridioides difficile]VIG38657.1 xanthine/uracile permease [Clostridioides difficile]VIH43887.1 xanthine/uracile permease [Clostridioides difficile]VIH99867.1 xanthine/uracile permease [Clostridioides difficile]